jgi:hypothetical protein
LSASEGMDVWIGYVCAADCSDGLKRMVRCSVFLTEVSHRHLCVILCFVMSAKCTKGEPKDPRG